MRKNISWAKKLAIACLTGAMMIAGSVSALAATTVKPSYDLYANGHLWTLVNETEATCTIAATKTYLCALHGERYTETVAPALGHDFGDWVTTTFNASETVEHNGFDYRVCEREGCVAVEVKESERVIVNCKHNYVELAYVDNSDPAKYHTYNKDNGFVLYESILNSKVVSATCITNGQKISYCTKCASAKVETVAATGHDITVLKVAQEPTEKIAGVEFVGCLNEKHEGIEALTADSKASALLSANVVKVEIAPLACQDGEHQISNGYCELCHAPAKIVSDTSTGSDDKDTDKDTDTDKTPSGSDSSAASTSTVSSGTVVGGGIAAAGILTLITLIVKYLGSVLF
jgi:hypothetical protein